MVSNTRQSQTRREMRHQSMGRGAAKLRAKLGTPAFPVHPPGYDANAPDARKTPAKNSAK
jgi:hypothetical protein